MQKKKILQRYTDPLYLIPSNPCNTPSKYSSIGTRILMLLTWRTRCIRNAPCRCIAYAVSSFSAGTSSQYTFFSCSATLQQTLIQIGRDRNFVDKADPFDLFSVNSAIVGETLPIGGTQKIKQIQPIWCIFRNRRDCNADGDCVRLLEKVKACDVALIKQMKLSEWNEFFICLIVLSHIAGLLLCLMTCNRSRKHYNPACSEYVS